MSGDLARRRKIASARRRSALFFLLIAAAVPGGEQPLPCGPNQSVCGSPHSQRGIHALHRLHTLEPSPWRPPPRSVFAALAAVGRFSAACPGVVSDPKSHARLAAVTASEPFCALARMFACSC